MGYSPIERRPTEMEYLRSLYINGKIEIDVFEYKLERLLRSGRENELVAIRPPSRTAIQPDETESVPR